MSACEECCIGLCVCGCECVCVRVCVCVCVLSKLQLADVSVKKFMMPCLEVPGEYLVVQLALQKRHAIHTHTHTHTHAPIQHSSHAHTVCVFKDVESKKETHWNGFEKL